MHRLNLLYLIILIVLVIHLHKLIRFKTSSLKVLGNQGHSKYGEWSIIGGTGEFAFAQGTVKFKETDLGNDGNYKELHVRAMCLTLPKPVRWIHHHARFLNT